MIYNFVEYLKNIKYEKKIVSLNTLNLLYNKRYDIYYSFEEKYVYDKDDYDLILKYIDYIKVLLYLDEKDSIKIMIGDKEVLVDNNLLNVEKYLGINIKRKRYEDEKPDSEWLSPNIIKAGIVGDNYTVIKKIKNKRNVNPILLEGIEFEKKIIEEIKENNKNDFVQIGESSNINDVSKFKLTIEEIARGCPIIYQPVLYDYDRNIYCCPDLIVRSDFVNNICPGFIVKNHSCFFSQKWHYIVIDIKNKKLKLNVDMRTIRNDLIMKMNKAQIYICNEILGKIQDYEPSNGYILGNGWTVESKNKVYSNTNPFNKLGLIDFYNKDKHIKDMIIDVYTIIDKYKDVNFNNLPPEL